MKKITLKYWRMHIKWKLNITFFFSYLAILIIFCQKRELKLGVP